MRPTQGSTISSWPRSLWWLILAGLLIRLLALAATASIDCLMDECAYTDLASKLAAGAGFLPHRQHYWPPGYIAFLAAHIRLGAGILGAKITQVLLSTLLIPLVFLLADRATAGASETVRRRAGLAAAALVALDPTLIAFSHYLWSETLFLPLFTGGLILVLDAQRTLSPRRAAAAGLLLGFACLVKVLPLYLVPLLAIWMVLRQRSRRSSLLVAAALAAATFAVVLPWTVRNYLVYQRFVLVETTLGKNLVRGNNAISPYDWDWGFQERSPRKVLMGMGCSNQDPIEYNRCLTAKGLDLIRGAPGLFLSRIGTKVADLFNPTSFLVRHIRRGLYGDWPPGLADLSVLLVALFNMGLMALAVMGWGIPEHSAARSLLAILLAFMLVVHSITFGMSRFRLPLEPWMAVGAGLFLAAPARGLHGLWHGRRHILSGLLLLSLLLCWSFRVSGLFYEPPDRLSDSSGALPAVLLAARPPVSPMIRRVRAMSVRVGPGQESFLRPAAGARRRNGLSQAFRQPTPLENRARQNPLAVAPPPVRATW